MTTDPLQRPLQFVTGKGGVGKSVVAAAIGCHLAQSGRRTLLCQINTEDSHSNMLGVEPIDDNLREVLPNLYAVNTTPAAALQEYGMRALRFRTVYNAVFENRVVAYFLKFVPALGELNMLGKVWHHVGVGADHQDGLSFDHVIVDAPATGHGLSFIRVARVVANGALPGALQAQSGIMAETIENPELTAVHIVSLPEQMAVEESIELSSKIQELKAAPLGIGVLNRYGPHLFYDGDAEAIQQAASSRQELHETVQAGAFRAMREQEERSLRHRLQTNTKCRWQEVGEYFFPISDKSTLEQVGTILFDQTVTSQDRS